MIEEYNKTLQLLKNQKNLLLEKANKTDLDPELLNNIINQICLLDKKINEYSQLIKNENNEDNQAYTDMINDNDYNNKVKLTNNNSLIYKNKKGKKTNNNKIIKTSYSEDKNDTEIEV